MAHAAAVRSCAQPLTALGVGTVGWDRVGKVHRRPKSCPALPWCHSQNTRSSNQALVLSSRISPSCFGFLHSSPPTTRVRGEVRNKAGHKSRTLKDVQGWKRWHRLRGTRSQAWVKGAAAGPKPQRCREPPPPGTGRKEQSSARCQGRTLSHGSCNLAVIPAGRLGAGWLRLAAGSLWGWEELTPSYPYLPAHRAGSPR